MTRRPRRDTVDDSHAAMKPFGVTWQEAEVARLLARDSATDAEIAAEVGISLGGVKRRMQKLCRKLGADNRRRAAVRIRQLMGGERRRWRPEEDGDAPPGPTPEARQ